jgi:hypothetical protein
VPPWSASVPRSSANVGEGKKVIGEARLPLSWWGEAPERPDSVSQSAASFRRSFVCCTVAGAEPGPALATSKTLRPRPRERAGVSETSNVVVESRALGPARRAHRHRKRNNPNPSWPPRSASGLSGASPHQSHHPPSPSFPEPRPTVTPPSPPPSVSGALAATARNATLLRRRC